MDEMEKKDEKKEERTAYRLPIEKCQERLGEQPIISSRFIWSKDFKSVGHVTECVDWKPRSYYEKMLADLHTPRGEK